MKIVLTGGPSAGKTTVVEVLSRTGHRKTVLVPEAASILFSGGFPRSGLAPQMACQQRAIYFVQRELENLAKLASEDAVTVCDRGTLDGLAYWPFDEASFFEGIGSSMEAEIARYDWVIHLDTASSADYKNSEVRLESIETAAALNRKVKDAWKLHPRRIIIPNNTDFFHKVDQAAKLVGFIKMGYSVEEIKKALELPA